ncbi:RNA-directed DNA polymerase, eukaryota [Tanacetum coccineum]|uniref:RNA-directed DNA polymerase, eukaryota n=1 Tax=Tanacetum coccineum TaxID=301880 RepID=A0ABQ4X0S4_9ASTR
MFSHRSNEDHVAQISKSIFVTNFPDNFGSRELWKICESYGKVVDVYIPNRKSKAGKRFAFVHFIRVEVIDRLVGNLCKIWIGRLHLHANVVRFERARKPYNLEGFAHTYVHAPSGPYATAVKGNTPLNVPITPSSSVPTLVLDDSCVIERDLSRHVKLSYLGGMWVMLEFDKVATKQKLLQHIGVNSWFQVLQDAVQYFVSDERVVFVDIEGIPLNVWSRETFLKICKKWGETMDIEDNLDSSYAQKRMCIKTKHADNILEKFKVIFKGKVFMARAKELFAWTLIFLEHKESVYTSNDESVQGAKNKSVGSQYRDEDSEDDSDVDGVSETIFGDTPSSPNNYNGEMDSSSSFSHLPSFTPEELETRKENDHVEAAINNEAEKVPTPLVNAKVMNNSQEVQENVDVMNNSNGESAYQNDHNVHSGGFILGLMEDMIRVGQSMGYTMEGCLGHKTKKEWVKELNIKHNVNFLALQETKMDRITHMDVKFMWGNSNYQFVSSDSAGNSGGILCVWEVTVFKKDYVTVSDNFIAIYGTWISCNSKVLIVVIYAPQQPSHKRVLWEYISTLLVRWNGETIIMGDFNEVRSKDERLGSVFNQFSARNFDHFITSSGLVYVKLEGYAFTWSHPSATKMSKLDRFLVTYLRILIRRWVKDKKLQQSGVRSSIIKELSAIDKDLDRGNVFDVVLLKFFVDGNWSTEPGVVKDAFKNHFAAHFKQPVQGRLKLNISFTNWLSSEQVVDMDRSVSRDEIRMAVWNCGKNKSPRPDGYTFEFFRKYWWFVGLDFCAAVEHFFENGSFPKGCYSSFIALILKVTDAKFVTDFRPISLIGCVYKVVTKVLSIRLATVISNIVSDTQSAFVANR